MVAGVTAACGDYRNLRGRFRNCVSPPSKASLSACWRRRVHFASRRCSLETRGTSLANPAHWDCSRERLERILLFRGPARPQSVGLLEWSPRTHARPGAYEGTKHLALLFEYSITLLEWKDSS